MSNIKKYIALFLTVLIMTSMFSTVSSVFASDTAKEMTAKESNSSEKQKDENADNNGDGSNAEDSSKPEKDDFVTITYELNNVTSENTDVKIEKNAIYTTILYPESNCKISTVVVYVGKSEEQVHKNEDGTYLISIPATMNITITAYASANTSTTGSTTTTTEEPISVTTEPTTATIVEPTTVTAEPTSTTTVEPTSVTTEPTTTTTEPIKVLTPNGTINSTNKCAVFQNVTIKMNNTQSYYWGTKKNPSDDLFTSVKSDTVVKKVSKSGTYYLVLKNQGKVVKTKKTFYKTTLNANGGNISPQYIITENGKKITLPKPIKSKYGFNGWVLGSNTKTKYSTVKVAFNKTYKAFWTNPKVTVKIHDKIIVKNGFRKFISYNKNGVISDWYKYSVNCYEYVVWKPSNDKSKKVMKIDNDTKNGIVTFNFNSSAKHKTAYKVECEVSGKKVFSMELLYFKLEKLSKVSIKRTNKNTVSLSWGKTTNSQKYLITITDKKTKKTNYITLSSKAKSYKYKKLNPSHKYSVSVRLINNVQKLGIEYYGDANKKII